MFRMLWNTTLACAVLFSLISVIRTVWDFLWAVNFSTVHILILSKLSFTFFLERFWVLVSSISHCCYIWHFKVIFSHLKAECFHLCTSLGHKHCCYGKKKLVLGVRMDRFIFETTEQVLECSIFLTRQERSSSLLRLPFFLKRVLPVCLIYRLCATLLSSDATQNSSPTWHYWLGSTTLTDTTRRDIFF